MPRPASPEPKKKRLSVPAAVPTDGPERERVTDPEPLGNDRELEGSLRPRRLSEFV